MINMSSTPVVSRRQPIKSTRVNGGPYITASDSDSDSTSGYSTPIGKLATSIKPAQVVLRLDAKSDNIVPVVETESSLAEGCDSAVRCDVTCRRSFSGDLCDCSLRWKTAANQALQTASSGASRRAAYERAERAAGRDPDAKICARLERDEPLYPNCDMTIWLRTCDVESVVPVEGQVHGVIPLWIKGTLLRNGPGRLQFGDDEFLHLFDASALLHRYAVFDGTATYQSRYLRTNTFLRNSAAQRIVVSEFGTRGCPDPCHTIFNRVAAIFTPGEALSDNALISVYPFGDEFYAFTESTIVTRFDPVTLHTIDRVNLANYVGVINHSAHPIIFPDAAISLGMALGALGPRYTLLHFPISTEQDASGTPPPNQDLKRTTFNSEDAPKKNSKAENSNSSRAFVGGRIVGSVAARWPLHPSYMHTFGLTESYFVLVEQPLTVSVAKAVYSQLEGDPTAAAIKWFPEHPTFIHLIERATGRHSHSFCTFTLFFLHVINSYERDDTVIIDICCYENPEMINCMYIEALRNGQRNPDYARMFRGRPLRFELPLKGDVAVAAVNAVSQPCKRSSETIVEDPAFIRPSQLSTLGCETPRIPQHLVGKFYRYFYAISSDVDLENPGTLIKVDTIGKRSWRWDEDGVYPSEPIFVPRPSSKAEDDGVILSALTWSNDDRRTALLVLDAPTWTEVGRVEFKTPGVVPKCLHGWFAPDVV